MCRLDMLFDKMYCAVRIGAYMNNIHKNRINCVKIKKICENMNKITKNVLTKMEIATIMRL